MDFSLPTLTMNVIIIMERLKNSVILNLHDIIITYVINKDGDN